MTPEFSRPLLAARVPKGGCHEKIAADSKECEGLAKRIGVDALHALKAHFVVTPWRGRGLKVEGPITARMTRQSVISLEPFETEQVIETERYFLPQADDEADQLENGAIDLGEIAAETLALELDPYPRKPGEVFETPPDEDHPPSPFAKLLKLRSKE